MKKSVILAVAILAMAGIVGAMAFSTAMVSNEVKTGIVSTDVAFLAVEANPQFSDFAKIEEGVMKIDFTGESGTQGFQPNSNYKFDDLFYVTNKLTKPVKVGMRFSSVYVGDEWPKGLHTVDVSSPKLLENWTKDSYTSSLLHGYGDRFADGIYEGRYIILQPEETVGISWSFIVGDEPVPTFNSWSLQIHGEAIRENMN